MNLNQSNLTCENYRVGSETVRIVGKISTTVQIIADGAIIGSMQLKANVVRDLKFLFGTEALPGHMLSQKLSKFETSENLNELRSMKTKPNAKKTEPTKKSKSTKKNECEVPLDKKESITNDCDKTQHENAANSSDSYLQSFISKLSAMKSELENKFYSNQQHFEAAPKQEGAHHTLAPDQTPEKNANDLDNESNYPDEESVLDYDDDEFWDILRDVYPTVPDDTIWSTYRSHYSHLSTSEMISEVKALFSKRSSYSHPTKPRPAPSSPSTSTAALRVLQGEMPTIPVRPQFIQKEDADGWISFHRVDDQLSSPSTPLPSNSKFSSHSESPNWYRNERERRIWKHELQQNPRRTGLQEKYPHCEVPHGPDWCRRIFCEELDDQDKPEECGYHRDYLPYNFQTCSRTCTGAWCTCEGEARYYY